MIPSLLKPIFFAATAALVLASPARADGEPALHIRNGLPHVAARPAELRIAYLGGSITAAPDGWRSLTTDHLRIRFPNTDLVEISAGLPGTGSDLGACRLGRDVLRHRPDLLLVEFAVNDTSTPPAQIERTIEGIVRQTWQANPAADILFVYTVSTPHLPDLTAGRFPPSAAAMERVAQHYGIPSVHFGIEVVQRVAAGTLVFKNADAPDDPRTFSLDGVHPTAAGHRVYAEVLQNAFADILAHSAKRPPLPPPLHIDNWANAHLRELDFDALKGDWAPVQLDDPYLRGAAKTLLPPTWRTESAGDAIVFEFTGRNFGLLGIAAPDSGEFRVTVDDRPPLTVTFFDAFVSPSFCRLRPWFFPGTLAEGPHRVRIELLDTRIDKAAIKATRSPQPLAQPELYEPHRLTISGLLIVGDSTP